MTAYVIVDVLDIDYEKAARYIELGQASIARYDGVYLTQPGAPIDHVEGPWTPDNVVVLGFPSMARAREWYGSAEYAEALAVKGDSMHRNMIFVAGADET